jgi:predicted RecB family nuclease
MIRTGKIYLHETPQIERNPVELFLDIEGTPDRNYFYLTGILVCSGDTSSYYPFWAGNMEDAAKIWHQFLDLLERYPDCPIYHYGNYEQKNNNNIGKML